MSTQDPRWTADTAELAKTTLIGWFQPGDDDKARDHIADGVPNLLAALADAGLLCGPSGPQGDEPAAPRVWAMPEIPADVTAVMTRHERRYERRDGRWTYIYKGRPQTSIAEWELLADGPLTEVDGSQT